MKRILPLSGRAGDFGSPTVGCMLLGLLLICSTALAQNKQQPDAGQQLLQQRYGPNFQEVLSKYGNDPARLQQLEADQRNQRYRPSRFDARQSIQGFDDHYVARSEAEPNNFFDTADNINDVLALEGPLQPDEYNGALIQAALEAGDVDVYQFTVDPDRMYYFAATHSFLDDGTDGLDVSVRLFHESDLDTTFVVNEGGIAGNDKMRGDIIGRNPDGRNGSGDFRLTGWTSPVDPDTGEKLTGDFYLWIFNEDGNAGTYYMTAYSVPLEPFVSKFEPNQTNVEALNAGLVSQLPDDAVVRTFMLYNPDTVRIVDPPVPVQGNSVYPQLLAEGDEDVDHFLLDYKAGHTMVVETMEYFGWYRDNDGSIGPGGTRLSDTRIRVYDADYTGILFEDDDGAREFMDGPNNTHSRIVLTPENMAANGITSDSPLWLWVSAWASKTRDPGQSVDNSDPGRLMYNVYIHQYSEDPTEVEPNNSAEEAMGIAARSDTLTTGSFDDGSEDWYRVFLNEVRMYTLFTTAEGATMELYREFESDIDGSTTLTENLLTDGGTLVAGYVPDESGAYLIKLSGGTGAYQLSVIDKGEIYGGRVSNEPDDVAEDALTQDPLEVGPGAAAETAMIYPSGDVDHYYFNAAEGTDLTLSLGNTNAGLVEDFDVQMTLIGPDGAEVETSTSGISHTAAGGQYIVRVEAVNGTDVGFYRLSGGEPFEEQESNNTAAEANLIALGGNIYEASLTAGDVDYYRFTLEPGNLYSFRSLDNGTGGALSVEFLDAPDGANLLDESDWVNNYDGDNFKIANIMPRRTQTYYLRVAGNAGPYKLTSRVNPRFRALIDKGEPNNSAEEADAQGAYQSFGADVEYALFDQTHPRFFGDEDWFRVELVAGQTVTAETKPVGGDDWSRDTDTRIVIMAEDGTTELANDDDGGNDWYSLASHTAAADGPVYVIVRTSRTPDAADDRSLNRGDYLLNIDVTSSETEPNNTFAEAEGNPLVKGFIDAEFTDDDTVDIFAVTLQAGHIYHVRTLRPEGGFGGQFTAQLFSADDTGTNLLNEENTGYNTRYSGDNVKLNIIPEEDGDYFLQLTGDAAGAYQVGFKGRDISTLLATGEPNNSIEDADAVGTLDFDNPGEVTTYMLYNPDFVPEEGSEITAPFGDDLDYYRYELVAGDTLVAEMSPVDGPTWSRDFDGFMELYDAEGNLLADNDDGGFDWHSRIEHVAETDGAYYVLVRSQDFGCASDPEASCDRDPARGEYNLNVIKRDGSPVQINTEADVPGEYRLDDNYPNPFNPSTTITYALPATTEVTLSVYNALGQRVATLVNASQSAGTYSVSFDAHTLSSGLYLYRLETGDFVSVKKMLLVK